MSKEIIHSCVEPVSPFELFEPPFHKNGLPCENTVYIYVKSIKNLFFCNSSATKTPSHKEKILISKQYMKGKNSFLKKSDDAFSFCK